MNASDPSSAPPTAATPDRSAPSAADPTSAGRPGNGERDAGDPAAASRAAKDTDAPDTRTVDLRDPYFAALLAFLVPGLGHWYQRRRFKAVLYAVCVLGLFGWGMKLGESRAVSFRPPTGPNAGNRKEFIYYLGQIGTGLVALPAIIQYRRYYSPGSTSPGERIDSPFTGTLEAIQQPDVHVDGTIALQRGEFGDYFGTLVGLATPIDPDGAAADPATDPMTNPATNPMANPMPNPIAGPAPQPIELQISGLTRLGDPLENAPDRALVATVVGEDGYQMGLLDGTLPRPWLDRFEMPLSEAVERDINTRLGTLFDLATVMTMIAGLLNFLAIYDALQGPAYGYSHRSPSPLATAADAESGAA